MKTALALFVALGAANSVVAQAANAPAAPPPDVPMAGVVGYNHPVIGPEDCKVVNPGLTQCTIPAKSAGAYVVVAAGTSTAKEAGAAQQLTIGGDGWKCSPVTNTAKWSSGPRTFQVACLIEVLTDQPLRVAVRYDDVHAEKDPKGPVLQVQAAPWNGVLSATIVGAK
jgi:hypothetical protein